MNVLIRYRIHWGSYLCSFKSRKTIIKSVSRDNPTTGCSESLLNFSQTWQQLQDIYDIIQKFFIMKNFTIFQQGYKFLHWYICCRFNFSTFLLFLHFNYDLRLWHVTQRLLNFQPPIAYKTRNDHRDQKYFSLLQIYLKVDKSPSPFHQFDRFIA